MDGMKPQRAGGQENPAEVCPLCELAHDVGVVVHGGCPHGQRVDSGRPDQAPYASPHEFTRARYDGYCAHNSAEGRCGLKPGHPIHTQRAEPDQAAEVYLLTIRPVKDGPYLVGVCGCGWSSHARVRTETIAQMWDEHMRETEWHERAAGPASPTAQDSPAEPCLCVAYDDGWKDCRAHPGEHRITEHGTTRCPHNGGIAAHLDDDWICSSCGVDIQFEPGRRLSQRETAQDSGHEYVESAKFPRTCAFQWWSPDWRVQRICMWPADHPVHHQRASTADTEGQA